MSTSGSPQLSNFTGEEPEVLVEMPPPPLSNRKYRKLAGGASLNHKYNRWKDDMELWAQGSKPLSGSRGRSFMEPTSRLGKRTASHLDPAMFYQHTYDPVRKADALTFDSKGSHTLQSEKSASALSYNDPRSSALLVEPDMVSSASMSNKRPRLDGTETYLDDAEKAPFSGAISGGPFSTPHFRLSLGTNKRTREQPSEALDYSEATAQGPDDGFGDDIAFEKLLYLEGNSSPLRHVSSPPPAAQLSPKIYGSRQAFSPTPPHESSPPLPSSSPPPPLNPAHVLLDCALPSRDRIQQIGNQMRRSAAAKISRFSVPCQSPSGEVLNLKHGNGLKEVEEQDRERVSGGSSSPTVPRTAFLNTSGTGPYTSLEPILLPIKPTLLPSMYVASPYE
ncbi:hypothetical protein EC968_010141 [Mortierella alpina]|nr:hypothetical protein EC968_010141 [Mortierella alpina]